MNWWPPPSDFIAKLSRRWVLPENTGPWITVNSEESTKETNLSSWSCSWVVSSSIPWMGVWMPSPVLLSRIVRLFQQNFWTPKIRFLTHNNFWDTSLRFSWGTILSSESSDSKHEYPTLLIIRSITASSTIVFCCCLAASKMSSPMKVATWV